MSSCLCFTTETQSSRRCTESFGDLSNPINPPKSWFRLFFLHVCFHSGIIEYQIAKSFDSYIQHAVINIKIRSVVIGGIGRISALWHSAEIKKESRRFCTIKRKILSSGYPLSFCQISIGSFRQGRQHYSYKGSIIVSNQCFIVDPYFGGCS